jgi:hypothetical protein
MGNWSDIYAQNSVPRRTVSCIRAKPDHVAALRIDSAGSSVKLLAQRYIPLVAALVLCATAHSSKLTKLYKRLHVKSDVQQKRMCGAEERVHAF